MRTFASLLLIFLIALPSICFAELKIQPYLFVASDQVFTDKDVSDATDIMENIRKWYARQMSDNGYGFMTFNYERIKAIQAREPLRHFSEGRFENIEKYIGLDGVEVVFIVGLLHIKTWVAKRADGVELRHTILGTAKGMACYIPFEMFGISRTTAHEIGHAFGLEHPEQAKPAQIMNFFHGEGLTMDDVYLSKESADKIRDNEWLRIDDSLSVFWKSLKIGKWANQKKGTL